MSVSYLAVRMNGKPSERSQESLTLALRRQERTGLRLFLGLVAFPIPFGRIAREDEDSLVVDFVLPLPHDNTRKTSQTEATPVLSPGRCSPIPITSFPKGVSMVLVPFIFALVKLQLQLFSLWQTRRIRTGFEDRIWMPKVNLVSSLAS